jgi:hypothetical protein
MWIKGQIIYAKNGKSRVLRMFHNYAKICAASKLGQSARAIWVNEGGRYGSACRMSTNLFVRNDAAPRY